MLAGISECAEQNDATRARDNVDERDSEYLQLLEFMGWDPVTVDTLVNRSGLTAEEVSSMLLILELAGSVESLVGGTYIQREEGPTK